jgi:pSer/pThr/pTyr-binding forkhead associated (FHA) protein
MANQTEQYHILTIYEPSQTREILLDRLTYSIGRDPLNAVAIDNRGISRQHAILFRMPAATPGEYLYRLVDGNASGQRSRNGIMVNGIRIKEKDLQSGDQILLGSVVSVEYKLMTAPQGGPISLPQAEAPAYRSVKAPVVSAQKTLVNLSLLDFVDELGESETTEIMMGARL